MVDIDLTIRFAGMEEYLKGSAPHPSEVLRKCGRPLSNQPRGVFIESRQRKRSTFTGGADSQKLFDLVGRLLDRTLIMGRHPEAGQVTFGVFVQQTVTGRMTRPAISAAPAPRPS